MNIPNNGPNRIKVVLLSSNLMLLLRLLFKVSLFTVVFMDVLVAPKKAKHVGQMKKVIKLYIPII